MPLLISWEGGPWEWTPAQSPAEDWSPLVRGALPPGEDNRYAVQRLLEAGAEPLTTPARVDRFRIPAVFNVPAFNVPASGEAGA
jgi:hypothetical protein